MTRRAIPRATPPLRPVYQALLRHFGPQHWWPGDTREEIIIGAILTQNTAWTNVEKAIEKLKQAQALSLAEIHRRAETALAELIRPAGFFRVKARRLQAFARAVHEDHGGRLDRLFALDTTTLRGALLSIHGVGPETADCILLYAAGRPVFVVDAYTRRFMLRHGWIKQRDDYETIARTFCEALPKDATLFNEYHALIVALGKRFCRKSPECAACPLRTWLREPALAFAGRRVQCSSETEMQPCSET